MTALRFLPVVVACGVLAVAAAFRAQEPVVTQPIPFNHAIHAKENLGCIDCHAGAETGASATIPLLSKCMLCHKEPQGKHPDEPKLRALAEAKDEVGWLTVNRMPGHVYFSHVAHVRFGKMECAECHGNMASSTEPPPRSQVENLTMTRCMQCHTERDASNDCIACHK